MLDERRLTIARKADAWLQVAIGHEQLAKLTNEPFATWHKERGEEARRTYAAFMEDYLEDEEQNLKVPRLLRHIG